MLGVADWLNRLRTNLEMEFFHPCRSTGNEIHLLRKENMEIKKYIQHWRLKWTILVCTVQFQDGVTFLYFSAYYKLVVD